MWFYKKLKASALQYTLVVSVLIAIIIFAFISLIHLQQKLVIKNDFYVEAIENVNTGFDYIANKNIPYNKLQTHTFTDNPQEETTLLKRHWGIFNLAFVTSKVKNEYFKKVALLGNNNAKKQALYLQETNKPLVVVGNTKITGNVSLPKQGIKAGNIAGVSYYTNRLIYGRQQQSTKTLPLIENMAHIKNLCRQNYINDSIVYFQLSDKLNKIQKFTDATSVYKQQEEIILKDVSLQGNIIINSGKAIKIEHSANLKDVILIAPKIEISNNVIGNFQCFASESIVINKNCTLNYPSALILVNEQKSKSDEKIQEENNIFIDENTTLKGVILYDGKEEKNTINFKPQIIISKNTKIWGEVYCNQNIELLGSIFGSVYTQNFIVKRLGSVYVNHIYNGIIDSKKLPEQYCGLLINNSTLKVAKWMY